MNQNTISIQSTIKEALAKFNQLAPQSFQQTTLFVCNEKNQMVGTLTEGDIRRTLLKGNALNDGVEICMNKNFKYLNQQNFSSATISILKEKKIRFVPFLNKNKIIERIYDLETIQSILPVEAVIMCGGKGERLRPLTTDIPKPLLQVGNKPIMEHSIDRMSEFGIQKFHLSVNYLKEKIITHFSNGEQKGIEIKYIEENSPLGTIGSLSLIKKISTEFVLVQNGDLITNINYEKFYLNAVKSKAAISVATVPYTVDVPFAILNLDKKNQVKALHEKPRYTYEANAGIYLIHHTMLKFIPKNKAFNATDLIQAAIDNNLIVNTFPILGYWTDVGRMEDFVKVQNDISVIYK
jgi:dTDP-glucose pyrophosphorylase/predicted transcriptional regulator